MVKLLLFCYTKLSADPLTVQFVIHTFDQKRLFGYAMNATLVPMEDDASYVVLLVSHRISPFPAAAHCLLLRNCRYIGCVLLRRVYTVRKG